MQNIKAYNRVLSLFCDVMHIFSTSTGLWFSNGKSETCEIEKKLIMFTSVRKQTSFMQISNKGKL